VDGGSRYEPEGFSLCSDEKTQELFGLKPEEQTRNSKEKITPLIVSSFLPKE